MIVVMRRVRHHLLQVMAWKTRTVVAAEAVGVMSPSCQHVVKTETSFQVLGEVPDRRLEFPKASLRTRSVAFSRVREEDQENLSLMTTLCCGEDFLEAEGLTVVA